MVSKKITTLKFCAIYRHSAVGRPAGLTLILKQDGSIHVHVGQKWYYLSPEKKKKMFDYNHTIESLPSSKMNKNLEFWRYVRYISRLLYAALQAPAEAPEDPWTKPTLCVNINNLYSSLPILKRHNSQLHWSGWNPTWTACLSVILRVRNTQEKLAPESEQVCMARLYRNHYCNVLSPTLSSMVFTHNSRCIVNHRMSLVARTPPCTNDSELSSQPAPSRLPDGRPDLPDIKRLCTGSMQNFRSGTLCYGEQFGK